MGQIGVGVGHCGVRYFALGVAWTFTTLRYSALPLSLHYYTERNFWYGIQESYFWVGIGSSLKIKEVLLTSIKEIRLRSAGTEDLFTCDFGIRSGLDIRPVYFRFLFCLALVFILWVASEF